jgi:hypothetical protein
MTKPGAVLSLGFSPDGSRIAAGLGGNTFEVWDADADAVMLRLPQTAVAWFTTWTAADALVLIPLDQTIRILRADPANGAGGVPPTLPADPAWREHLSFLSGGSGVWSASNARYRTEQNQEPPRYGMRYWMGFGGTAQHGCLWGAPPGQKPVVYWHFFTGWDPSVGALLVQQSGSTGVVGLGYESPETGIAEQRRAGGGRDKRRAAARRRTRSPARPPPRQ